MGHSLIGFSCCRPLFYSPFSLLFFLKPITEDLLFLPYKFFGRYLLRIRIKLKRTLRNAILNFSYCLATSSNGRRNLFCPTYGSEIFLEAEVLYTCFFLLSLFAQWLLATSLGPVLTFRDHLRVLLDRMNVNTTWNVKET